MFEHARQHGHKFMAAFDRERSDGDIVKMYASYATCEEFVMGTLLKAGIKHFYELIREGTPCKLYLDLEWKGPSDPETAYGIIHNVVNELKAYTKVRIREPDKLARSPC